MSDDRRKAWMMMLAKLVRPADPEAAATGLIAMLPMLTDIPDECFCKRCLADVAKACVKGYAFGTITAAFAEWWKANKHTFAPIALPGTESALDANDFAWVAYFRRREAENFIGVPAQGRANPREHCLSLVASQSTKAWEQITGLKMPGRDPKRFTPAGKFEIEGELA